MIPALVFTLAFLLSVSAAAQDVLSGLRDSGLDFAQVVPGKQLKFPRDHGAHPDYRIEWWYLTANLRDQHKQHWGLQWTLFRQSLSPSTSNSDLSQQGWSNNQVWMAHAAITTPAGHHHEQRFARGGIGQAGVNTIQQDGFFNAWLDDWQWRSQSPEMFPAQLQFSVGDYKVLMQLDTKGEFIANGINGYSQKSAQGQASYYYSQPHIRIAGTIDNGSGTARLQGQAWLDREWSSQALADNQQGWDWFSLHLDDGQKLMVYQLRHDDGEHWISGSWVDATGQFKSLSGDDIQLQAKATRDIKTATGQNLNLPLDWYLRLPAQNLSLRIKPLYDEQWMGTSIPYWEGVVLITGEVSESLGVGYMELTGYQ